MSPPLTRILDGKKHGWDGKVYPSSEEAEQACRVYRADHFDARVVQDDAGYLVYSRREVKESVTAGP